MMQFVHETYIVPALHAVKTWLQKKELLSSLCVLNVIYFGTSSGTGRRVHVGERGQEANLEGRQKRRRKKESKEERKEERNKLHSYP